MKRIPIAFLAELLELDATTMADEATVDDLLRRRLTKKERKILELQADGVAEAMIMEKLNADADRYKEIKEALEKKLRHPKIRNELFKEA